MLETNTKYTKKTDRDIDTYCASTDIDLLVPLIPLSSLRTHKLINTVKNVHRSYILQSS